MDTTLIERIKAARRWSDTGPAMMHVLDDALAALEALAPADAGVAVQSTPIAQNAGMVEKVAQVLAKASGVSAWHHVSEEGEFDGRVYWRRLARAALAALSGVPRDPEAPDMVLVPREPSEAMIDAYFDRCRDLGFTAHINATAAWSAMINAASKGA